MMLKALIVASMAAVAQAQCGGGNCATTAKYFNPQNDACYCDSSCKTFQDCCPDYMSECEAVTPSGGAPGSDSQCSGACVNTSAQVDAVTGGQCYCNPDCVKYQDCCTGYQQACGPDESIDGITPDGRTAIMNIELALELQTQDGPEQMSAQCQNSCGVTTAMKDQISGETCYCDEQCMNWGDCCTGFKYHCDFPARLDQLSKAFMDANPAQDKAMCGELMAASMSCNSGAWCDCDGCQDRYPQCDNWASQGFCTDGHMDGTAGWFQYACPVSCQTC